MRPSIAVIAALAGLLSGCATFSRDGGMDEVQATAAAELGRDVIKVRTDDDVAQSRQRTRNLLRAALSADAAVEVALLNNKGLQAAYNELGISETQLIQASLPPNPSFSYSDIAGGGDFEIERRVFANALAILALPTRRAIAEEQFRQAQLKAVDATLRI